MTLGSSLVSVTTIRNSVLALVTRTPWACTACGSRLMTLCTLFCTCTCAVSGLVPASKVSCVLALPAALLVLSMDSRPSMPFRLCSMICVTESSMVCAEAPG